MPLHPLGPPLTARDLAEINKSLFLLNQLVQYLDQAEKAGIDVTQLRDQRDTLYQQATSLKGAYFPESE